MNKSILASDGHVLSDKVMDPNPSLKRVFERCAQIVVTDTGRRCTSSHIDKRNPTGARREIIPDKQIPAPQVRSVRMKLPPSEGFTEQLPCSSIPMIPCNQIRKGPTNVDAPQGQVMNYLTHEDFVANPHSARNAKFDCASRE